MSRLYLCFGLLLLAHSVLAQEQFPLVPYSGIQLEYQWAGLEIDRSFDQEGSSRIRQLGGTVTDNVIKVFGKFFSDHPKQDRFLLEVSVDGQSKSMRLPLPDREEAAQSPQTFELEVPIDSEAKNVTILLSAITESLIGPREIRLQGTFKVQLSKQPDSSAPDRIASPHIVGRIERISGSLEANFAEWREWRSIKIESDITPGKLRTGDEGSAVVTLVEGERIFIDKNSEISLTEFGAKLEQGTLRFQGKGGDSVYVTETADYFVEFHGQHLAIHYADNETTCSVIDGYAILSRKDDLEQATTIRDGVRVQGDQRGIRLLEKVDLKTERDLWNQSGLGTLSKTNENSSMPEVATHTEKPNPIASPSSAADQKAKPRIEIVLPDDRSIPVITLDTVGGYTPDRKTEKPELIIFADGRVIINDLYGNQPQLTQQLSKDNVISFLDFMVNDHQFYELNSESIARAEVDFKAKQGGIEFSDVPITVIRLGILNQTYEVRCRGADLLAAEFPGTKSLQDFNAIEARLRKYMDNVRER
jgi:hypothetical protein